MPMTYKSIKKCLPNSLLNWIKWALKCSKKQITAWIFEIIIKIICWASACSTFQITYCQFIVPKKASDGNADLNKSKQCIFVPQRKNSTIK